ncbi:hypothetical protein KL930_005307 [Ogataea haglerorum]|uniref:RRM domain-containing protein n=1 Tax=Ogataea haglerorum TaxID=1937702 RepID=A0AAN6HY25_9ASCO|nr:uncharacterized protein KL911_004706 [Ogataea haglerorum]KAG7691393.1 hypothetical protein KL915_005289 [Ogataea haglerorum]KAG7691830.1 hypothetical protein KL951_005278 [Ogataea haglerorum]KAG7702225.1 hypothetical protein KL914_005356 [Ogataea haglerorum]KAG7702257.1 hypothetical protein KL950_005307 [Ogataea haglerorum]KAG7713035.1 hypothetical protein KL949_005329 [Ogataea haglerorum]
MGENVNFQGAEDWLEKNGVEVINLKSEECEKLMAKFIKERPGDCSKRAKTPRHKANYTLYIKNLNDKLPAAKLKQNLYILFSTYGDVIAINCTNRGKFRGQAWVALSSIEEAQAALSSLNGQLFFGKQLVIQYSNTKSHIIEQLEQDENVL